MSLLLASASLGLALPAPRSSDDGGTAIDQVRDALVHGRLDQALDLAEANYASQVALCGECPDTWEAANWRLAVLLEAGHGLEQATLDAASGLAASTEPLPPDHAGVRAEALRLLGRVRLERAEYVEAAAAFTQALDVADRGALPPQAKLEILLDAAETDIRRDDQAAARQRLEAAERLGLDPARDPRLLEIRAFFLFREGAYDDALLQYQAAVDLRRDPSAWPSRLPWVLSGLGDCHWVRGDPWSAATAYQEAVERGRAVLGGSHPWLVRPLGRWATAESQVGDLGLAFELHQEAVALATGVLGPTHPETIGRLNDFADARETAGDLTGAIELYRQGLAIIESTGRSGSDHAATLHSNLAVVLVRTGSVEEARRHLDQALGLWRGLFGEDHPFVAYALQAWGDALLALGDLPEAEAAFARALLIRQRFSGRHPDLGATLLRLAQVRARRGHDEAALDTVDRALQTLDERQLAARLDRSRALTLRARLLAPRPSSERQALADAVEAGRLHAAYLRQTLRYLGERQALAVAAESSDARDLALTLLAGQPSRSDEVFDLVIRTRALVLDELAARRVSQGGARGDEAAAGLRMATESASRRLATLLYRGAAQTQLESAQAEMERLEGELARIHTREGRRRGGEVGLSDIRATLPADAAVVAFVRYRASRDSSEADDRYGAFLLRGRQPTRFVPLGRAREVEDEIGLWRSDVSDAFSVLTEPQAAFLRVVSAGRQLRRRVWDPLSGQLDGLRQIFVVPDGDLAFVPVAALPRAGQGFLIENKAVIHYLAAERDLAAERAKGPRNSGLLALGAAAFDASPGEVEARLERDRGVAPGDSFVPAAPVRIAAMRGGCGSTATLRFEPLPESGAEVDDLALSWERYRPAEPARILKGLDAGEGALRRLASSARVLHIASHGFFLGGGCPDGSSGETIGNPLLLSGLALAGSNRRGAADADEDDGVLTAQELAGLDLRGVEWVILSACDSGLGKPQAGEGVLGLRRAFSMAGVRTQVMSLWPVDDHNARRWMSALYEERLARGRSTADAARAASLAVLAELRSRGEPPNPALWGAFVAAGDWR